MFTRKYILGILLVSLLGSSALAYGLSTEFLFKFNSGVNPTGATSNSTHIFIANNTKIEIFDLSGNSVDSFTPTNNPYDVAVNSTHIFVTTDTAGEIELFDLSGKPAPSILNGLLSTPLGITVNSTHVFVADSGTNRVEILNLSGIIVDTVGITELGDPTDVTTDSNGRILVADNTDDRIEIFDSSGNHLTFVGSSGAGDGQFSNPVNVDVDSNNRIVVVDAANRDIQIFDSSGNFLTTFGTSGTGDGQFTTPSGLTVDSNDRIIVADLVNNNVQVFAYLTESSTSNGGGGDSNKHKTAPTSGLDWNTHNLLVKGGVSVDGESFDITDNWWTPFEQIQISTNSTHSFTAKTFTQNGGLMVQEFAFGIPQIGEYENAEVMIEVHYNYDKSIRDIVVVQDTEVIRVSSINATTAQVSCDGGSAMCYQTSVSMVSNEPLKDKVYAINAWDMSRRSMMPHYFNDGINIVGEMMNPLPTKTIPGTIKGEGLITITKVEKYSDLWIAKDDRIFEMYGESDSFRLTNVETKRVTDTGHVNSRTHSAWDMLIEHQNEMAAKYFDSSKIQNPDMGFIAPILDDNRIDQRTETLQKLQGYQK